MRSALMVLMLAVGALAVATSTSADPVTLSGIVVDESGTPIADAEVFAVSFSYDTWEGAIAGTARTDADGRFAIPDVEYAPSTGRSPLNVAALTDDRALGWTTVQAATSDLRVECAAPVPITGRVTDEGGRGVAARLTVTFVYPSGAGWPRTEVLYAPDGLAERLSVDSDDEGRFAFGWAGPGVRVSATVGAPGMGTVEGTMRADLPAAQFTLLPAATLRGRVTCPEAPEAVAGLEVRVRGYDRERSFSWSGKAQTDAEGRFEIADLHPGPSSVMIRFSPEAEWQAPGQAVELAPGQTAEVEIALARAYLLTGRVVDEVTGAPIEGVRVYASPTPAGELTTIAPTDAEGRYRLRVLPGRTVVYPGGAPGYVFPEHGTKNVAALVTDQDVELADIMLKPGVTVKGRVIDAEGEPVAEAEVSHTANDFSFHRPLRTDERGEFAIEAVDPDRSFTVRARKGEAMTPAPVSVDPRAGDELLLEIRAGVGVRLAVRVVDADGAPVEGADVKTYWRAEMFGMYPTMGTTDADGRLVSEPQWPDGTYSVTATAPGCDQAQSEEWTAVSGETHDFGELVLVRAAGFVAGRVVDGAGQPVAGATVFNAGDGPARVEAQTDAEGRFRLEGLYPGGACVIAETETLFGGALIEVGAEDAVITITPEPAEVTLGEPIAIVPLTDEEADRAAALELIEAMLARPPEELGRYRGSFVGELAKLDADRAWALSDEEGGEYEDAIIRALGEGLLRDDPDQALAWLEGTENPTSRGFGLMHAVRKLAAIDPARARAELDALIPTAPEMGEPKYQAAFLAHCGETLYGLDPEAATPVIRQAEAIAQTLPLSDWDAYARGLVAEALCHFDLDGALALIANLQGDYEPTRHQPNIAARIAADNPAKAVELLGVFDDWQRGRATARVAYAMAPAHPDEALALARQPNEPDQQARALGYVALALRESDPARAAAVFGEAVALLAKQSPENSPGGNPYLSSTMAELAQIGAQIGYPAVERLVWRAIALRPAPSQEPWRGSGEGAAYLGTLAFVAPELTRELIRAEVERNPLAEAERYSSAAQSLLNAAAACDAKLALELALGLPHDDPADEYPQYAANCLQVVRMLLMPREQRFIEIAARYGGWVPGADDD